MAAADTVTKTSFDEAKAYAESQSSKLAAAEARLPAYESRERAKLRSYQPAIQSYIKDLEETEATVEQKPHIDSMMEWANTCHERPSLDTQMQLGERARTF